VNSLLESARRWVNAGLSFGYPELCQLCQESRATPAEGYVCGGCRERIRFVEPPFCARCGLPFEGAITTMFECSSCRDMELQFSSARSAVVARDQVLDVIHRYKYNRALWFEPFLADLLVQRAVPELAKEKWDFIVPIPLHPTRHREREFNQAERLASWLSRATGIPVNARLIRRTVPTRTQTQLSKADRIANVRKAFAITRRRKLNGERLVLLDDVFTTGATSSACAAVLKKAGAGEVCVWTVARGT
jgi:ComF family protein